MQVIEAQGLLFIGDPHISSRSPQRRQDDYTRAILNKLKESLELASKNDWVPMVLGDLFDRPRDTEPEMLSNLLRLLGESRHKPWVLVGNHDMVAQSLTQDTALNVVVASGCIHVMDTFGAKVRIQTPDAPRGVLVYGVPYGASIPTQVERDGADVVVMMTHHDLAISGASYPGSVEPLEIQGVDKVVNGHDHTLKAWQDVGQTRYYNLGNIARLSMAQFHHQPAVFSWGGGAHDFVKHPLRYVSQVFDMTGYNVKPSQTDTPTRDMPLATQEVSKFIEMLKGRAESKTDAKASEDGMDIKMDIDDILQEMSAEKDLPQGLQDLMAYILLAAKENTE